jgi:copper transport protein
VVAVAVAATVVGTGHPGVGGYAWLTTAGQTLHVLGAAVWLGGLVVLGTMLLRPGETDLAAVLPRWSRTAYVAVAVVVVTGTLQALREIDAVPELGATTYGRLLLSKLWFVGVMLALGWWANRFVVRHYRRVVAHAALDTALPTEAGPAGPRPEQVRSLRLSVLAEASAGIAVLVLTALLVNTQPAKTAYAPTYAKTLAAGPLTVQADVAPTKRGQETFHIYAFDKTGRPATVAQISAQLSLPSQSVGPITVPLSVAGTGHATASGVPVPIAGQWQLRVTVRVNDFDQYVTTFFYRVR